MDRLEKLLDELEAKNWRCNLDAPDRTMKPRVGKKTAKYTVYMNNGRTFGDPLYAWAMVDGDNYYDLVLLAQAEVEAKSLQKKADLEKEREKKKR